MSVRQIIVLAVALLAAIGALVMVRGLGGGPQKAEPTVAVTGPRVLVAAKDVAIGVALQPSDLEWRLWSTTALSPNFIEETEDSKALETYTGAVARQALVAGEPIVESRVVKPGSQGFMAAIVNAGFRAVSVPISEETAASGFILPNDRVDVILTRKLSLMDAVGGGGGSTEEVRSGIVLTDVRVLAIDKTYKTEASATEPEPVEGSVALLELSPRDSELLAQADEMGDISLALRPVRPQATKDTVGSQRRNTAALEQGASARDHVRIHAFGTAKDQSVMSQGAN